MQTRPFGATGLHVSLLGLGTGRIGDHDVDERHAEELLCGALDAGITLIDTARSYGLAEERIGRYLRHRRHEYVLATKGGYGADFVPDWTHAAIVRGIERALTTLRTDVLDIFLLHSCPRDTALREDILEALDRAHDAGKVKVVGYSGEGDALAACVHSSRFHAIECSVSLFDQKNLATNVPTAERFGLGVIAKRPLANAVWRYEEWPQGEDTDYWQRMHAMQLEPGAGGWVDLATRWAVFAPGVASAIVGTSRLRHLQEAIHATERGDLTPELRNQIATAFAIKDRGWEGRI